VPYQYVHEEVEARILETTIEILRKGHRIATHAWSHIAGKHSTPEKVTTHGLKI
jgi:hypothetical protein